MKKVIQQMICDVCQTSDEHEGVGIVPVVIDIAGQPKVTTDLCGTCERNATLGEVSDLGRRVNRPGPKKGAVRAVAAAQVSPVPKVTRKPKASVKAVVSLPGPKLPKGVDRTADGQYHYGPDGFVTKTLTGMVSHLRGRNVPKVK